MSINSIDSQPVFEQSGCMTPEPYVTKEGQLNGQSVKKAAADPAFVALVCPTFKPPPTSPLNIYPQITKAARPVDNRLSQALRAGYLPASDAISAKAITINDSPSNFLHALFLKFLGLFGVISNKPLHSKLMAALDKYHAALHAAHNIEEAGEKTLSTLKERITELQDVVKSIHLETADKVVIVLAEEIFRELSIIAELQGNFQPWPHFLSVTDALNMTRFSNLSTSEMFNLARVGFSFDAEKLCENINLNFLKNSQANSRFNQITTATSDWIQSNLGSQKEYREDLFLLIIKNIHAGRRLSEHSSAAEKWAKAADTFSLSPEETYKFFSARVPITPETVSASRNNLEIKWEKLGKGSINTVYSGKEYKFKGATQPSAAVFKPLDAADCEGLYLMQQLVMSGIDPNEPGTVGRNIASYKLNKLLGLDLIPATELAMVNGKFCIVMEKAEGNSSSEVRRAGRMPLYDGKMRKELTQLQWLDALSAQTDRHQANYLIKLGKEDEFQKITGIDNDVSFGKIYKIENASKKLIGGRNIGLPNVIDYELACRFEQLEESVLRSALDGLLSPEEIDATVSRLDEIRSKLSLMKQPHASQTGLIINMHDSGENDDAWFDDDVNRLLNIVGPRKHIDGDTYVQRDIQ